MPNSESSTDKITIQGIHLEITEAMRQVIAEKFRPLLRHDERIVRLDLRLHRDQTLGENSHYTATAQLEVRGPDLVAHAEGKDAYIVLDQLVEKVDRLLERRHGRRLNKRDHPQPVELNAELPKTEAERMS